jgi:hypothetical protein
MTLAPAELVPAEARSEEQSLPPRNLSPRKRGAGGSEEQGERVHPDREYGLNNQSSPQVRSSLLEGGDLPNRTNGFPPSMCSFSDLRE